MVIKAKFSKQEIRYKGEFEHSFCLYVDGNFYKEIGGLPTFLDCIKLYKQEKSIIKC